ncbi:MAG: hypothetical protein QNJ58_00710 [Desulfobacterales bacterium]|nr:hypothetical protein [Desulfobacterales bacterium]
MEQYVAKIINQGDESGNEMAVKFRLPSGLEIFGLPTEHFDENLLEGFGALMAANEVVSHCELLIDSGDVVSDDGKKYSATGKINSKKYIEALEPDY